MNWLDQLYQKRFVLFLITLAAILFGNLVFPEKIYEDYITPLFFVLNVLTGILLVSRSIGKRRIFIGLLVVLLLTHLTEALEFTTFQTSDYIRFGILFLFFTLVTKEIISQVWQSNDVDHIVILGVMSGYICLGLLGYFLFMSIEFIDPGSFKGITDGAVSTQDRTDVLYFSYISLLTIGYGEIVPISDLYKSASVLIGLLGQFYLVIITAIVVGKFDRQRPS